MEGEEEQSDNEGSFSRASIPKRIAIVMAGATVNIIFAIFVYAIINGITKTDELIIQVGESLKLLFTGKIGIDQMTGPVGISSIVAKTSGIVEFFELMAVISLSLGVTNLLPIPALDGGKILILIIEAIRRKPLNQQTELNIQLLGFAIIIGLSLIVTYNDILRIF